MAKQIERQITITYRWWRLDHKPIKPVHIEALDEKATERIQDMMDQGRTSGTLVDNICMSNDPSEGIEYTGYWETKTEKTEKS